MNWPGKTVVLRKRNLMTNDEILQMSYDVDDFINKMVTVHGIDFAHITASIFARLSVIAMETNQEIGMMRLICGMQDCLLKSLDASRKEE